MGFWRRLNDRLFNFPLWLRLPAAPHVTLTARQQMDEIRRELEQELEIDCGPARIEEPTPGELAARAHKLFNARGGA